MNAEKIRNFNDAELKQQEHDLMDQLFRLKFQMKMGQTESLNKIRGLRRDVARVKTIARQRSLGIGDPDKTAKTVKTDAVAKKAAPVKAKAKAAKAKVKTKAKTKPAKKKSAAKKK